MTSLHVICGLGPPQSKILATPMTSMLPKLKNQLKTNEAENWQKIKNAQLQLKKKCINQTGIL